MMIWQNEAVRCMRSLFFLTPEYDGEKRTFCAQLETYK